MILLKPQNCDHWGGSEAQATWAVAFVFLVSSGISEKLGSSGDSALRNSPWRERQLAKGKHLKIALHAVEAESFPVELSCSGTQCLEWFLYFDRNAIP